MKSADEYLAHVKALIHKHEKVRQWEKVREETQGKLGLFRYRLICVDGSLLELFERFEISETHVSVTKYSFHWQEPDGRLRKRWDNAAHYPEIQTFPHHVHDQDETAVMAHPPVTVENILEFLSAI